MKWYKNGESEAFHYLVNDRREACRLMRFKVKEITPKIITFTEVPEEPAKATAHVLTPMKKSKSLTVDIIDSR